MEEKKKGNTLYAILGVATLVVAIIGATFAYFSAQATATGHQIAGGTNDVGASLSVTVERVLFGLTAPEGEEEDSTFTNNLVPADLAVTTTGVATAVNNKCVANGYTGCHLYKITAKSTQTLEAADLLLQSFATNNVTDIDAWKFVVFTGEENEQNVGSEEEPKMETTYAVNNLVTGTTAEDFENSNARLNSESEGAIKGYNIHKDEDGKSLGMEEDTSYVYYLLIYLANENEQVQNDSDNNAAYSATGTYSGNVVLNAAGGKVVASFTSLG